MHQVQPFHDASLAILPPLQPQKHILRQLSQTESADRGRCHQGFRPDLKLIGSLKSGQGRIKRWRRDTWGREKGVKTISQVSERSAKEDTCGTEHWCREGRACQDKGLWGWDTICLGAKRTIQKHHICLEMPRVLIPQQVWGVFRLRKHQEVQLQSSVWRGSNPMYHRYGRGEL